MIVKEAVPYAVNSHALTGKKLYINMETWALLMYSYAIFYMLVTGAQN